MSLSRGGIRLTYLRVIGGLCQQYLHFRPRHKIEDILFCEGACGPEASPSRVFGDVARGLRNASRRSQENGDPNEQAAVIELPVPTLGLGR